MSAKTICLIAAAILVAGCSNIDDSAGPGELSARMQVGAVGVDQVTADVAAAALPVGSDVVPDRIVVFRYGDGIMVRVGAAESMDCEFYRYHEFRHTTEYVLGLEFTDTGVAMTGADAERVMVLYGADKKTIEEAHKEMCEALEMDVIITCVEGPGVACLAMEDAYRRAGC